MIVIEVGCTAPAPRPWKARNAIRAGMLQAMPQRIEPSTNSADADEHDRLTSHEVGELGEDRY